MEAEFDNGLLTPRRVWSWLTECSLTECLQFSVISILFKMIKLRVFSMACFDLFSIETDCEHIHL